MVTESDGDVDETDDAAEQCSGRPFLSRGRWLVRRILFQLLDRSRCGTFAIFSLLLSSSELQFWILRDTIQQFHVGQASSHDRASY